MNVFRKAGFFFAVMFVAAGVASAQETPPQNPPATPPPAAAVPAVASREPLTPARFRARRDAIGIMEGVLATAVKQGADDVVRQIKERQGQVATFLTGFAKARGFILEDYGVVFHVEIPGVRASVVGLMEQLDQRERQRSAPRAERLGETVDMPFDPNAAYTDAVKNTLIDKMLTYSIGLDLDPDEWLTIAARDGDVPPPGAIYESITMVLRVRGGDLAEFHAKRISRDEVLKRVQVRGF
jgi:hypothetical protein